MSSNGDEPFTIGARNLFWDDVDFDAWTIRWRAANDKKGYEQVVP